MLSLERDKQEVHIQKMRWQVCAKTHSTKYSPHCSSTAFISLTNHSFFSETGLANSLLSSLDKAAGEDDAYDFNTDYV